MRRTGADGDGQIEALAWKKCKQNNYFLLFVNKQTAEIWEILLNLIFFLNLTMKKKIKCSEKNSLKKTCLHFFPGLPGIKCKQKRCYL